MVEERLRRRVRTLEQQLEDRAREVVMLRGRVAELEGQGAHPAGARATSARVWHALSGRARRVMRAARRSVT